MCPRLIAKLVLLSGAAVAAPALARTKSHAPPASTARSRLKLRDRSQAVPSALAHNHHDDAKHEALHVHQERPARWLRGGGGGFAIGTRVQRVSNRDLHAGKRRGVGTGDARLKSNSAAMEGGGACGVPACRSCRHLAHGTHEEGREKGTCGCGARWGHAKLISAFGFRMFRSLEKKSATACALVSLMTTTMM